MSLLELLIDELPHPLLVSQQLYLQEPEDLLSRIAQKNDFGSLLSSPLYVRPWITAASSRDYGSTVQADDDSFQAVLDVGQFEPDELHVGIERNMVVIEGNHGEKKDDYGLISRHFVRKYIIPEIYDIENAVGLLSNDGILKITIPKLISTQEIVIPITQTGKPSNESNEKSQELCGGGDKKD